MLSKLFGGAVAVTALGAVVLGGALSWSNGDTTYGSAEVGELNWLLGYVDAECAEYEWVEPTEGDPEGSGNGEPGFYFDGSGDCVDPLIGPNGNEDLVGAGGVYNWGDFDLAVNFTDPAKTGLQVDGTTNTDCDYNDFEGRVAQGIGSDNDIEPNSFGGQFRAFIRVAQDASTDCMGALVSYTVGVTVETTNN